MTRATAPSASTVKPRRPRYHRPMIVERTITTEQGTFRVLDAGAGWPVLLIHAFPLSAEMWRPQLEAVPQGWRYVAPDLRGFGRVARRRTSRRPWTTTRRTSSRCSTRSRSRPPAIGGLSMGGYVTFALHRRAPERFTSLVLADTKAEADTPEGREGRRAMSALVKARGVGAVADSMLPKLLGEQSRTSERRRRRARADRSELGRGRRPRHPRAHDPARTRAATSPPCVCRCSSSSARRMC